MKFVCIGRPSAVFLALALAATFSVAAAHPTETSPARVTVQYVNPHKFTESQRTPFNLGFDHGNYLQKLKAFLIGKATPMLEPGQHLSITFTNIDLAGAYEPWLPPSMQDVRIMRDTYPPRFDFTFKFTGVDGKVIRTGTRELTDLTYMQDQRSAQSGDLDPLRYDKGLLHRWLRRGPAHW